jgi:hypothetical protein
MKKFIQKSSLFIIPFLFLHFLNSFIYVQNEGDIIRLGYLYNNPSPKSNISKQFNLNKQYTLVSEIKFNTKPKFDVLTIGDSFSEQDSLGYKNFLTKEGLSVLHMDRFLAGDPIQKIIELINGDFFDSVQTDYVILQSVERSFVQRCQKIDYTKSLYIDSIKNKINKYVKKIPKRNLSFLSNSTIKIPLTNIQYHFSYKPANSKTYKVTTNKDSLFTKNPNNLLFYEDDINNMKYKNDSLKIINSNNALNKINYLLSKKNIKLIVLISPDKYDLYYSYIKDKDNFIKPLFFKYYNNLSKEYSSINSFEVLSNSIANNKDVYYYDDTHWSPIGASVIAIEINKIINEIKARTHNKVLW